MVLIIRSEKKLERLDQSKKIIKAEEIWAFQDSKKIISEAERRRLEIIDAAVTAFEIEQRRGYSEGVEKAKLEQAKNMVGVISQTVDYFGAVEAQMANLVLDAIKKIIDEFSEEEKVFNIVKKSLTIAREQRHILIKIHPEIIVGLKLEIETLREKYPVFESLEIISDSNLAKDSCVIETEIGKIEASVKSQLQALKESFARVFPEPESDY